LTKKHKVLTFGNIGIKYRDKIEEERK